MKRGAFCILLLSGLLIARSEAPAARDKAERITESLVSVGIAHRAPRLLIRPIGHFSIIDQSTGELTALTRDAEYVVEADEKQRLIIGKHLLFGPARLLPGEPGEHVFINGHKYRGNILFRADKGSTVTAIDELGIEEYLQGVLPQEMNPEWPLEALKAQAVVARTFALNNLGKFSKDGYDLSDDALSQVYGGLEIESERVKEAVRQTAGEVLMWKGQRLDAYFHSTCGGHTTTPAAAWGGHVTSTPWPLRGVRDKYCRIAPHYRWDAYFRTEDLLRILEKHGYAGARLSNIKIARREARGYVHSVDIKIDGRWETLSAHRLRMWLGPTQLKSTQIQRIVRRKKGFLFKGRGYGHGVGLCQWGTRVQAIDGRSYRRILGHYFPKSSVQRFDL